MTYNLALSYDPDRRLQILAPSNVNLSIGKGCLEFDTREEAKAYQVKNAGHWFNVATLIVVEAT